MVTRNIILYLFSLVLKTFIRQIPKIHLVHWVFKFTKISSDVCILKDVWNSLWILQKCKNKLEHMSLCCIGPAGGQVASLICEHATIHVQGFTSDEDKENHKEELQCKSTVQKEMHPDLNEVIWGAGSSLRSRLSVFLDTIKGMTWICKPWPMFTLGTYYITSQKSTTLKICWAEVLSVLQTEHNIHRENYVGQCSFSKHILISG